MKTEIAIRKTLRHFRNELVGKPEPEILSLMNFARKAIEFSKQE